MYLDCLFWTHSNVFWHYFYFAALFNIVLAYSLQSFSFFCLAVTELSIKNALKLQIRLEEFEILNFWCQPAPVTPTRQKKIGCIAATMRKCYWLV